MPRVIDFSAIRRSLLRWYDRNKRDLPWRGKRDPYALWIAETMLQQTQVKTVIPYYRGFLRSFPSVRALERAPRQKVMAAWSGLGYYRRAENLKKAARVIVRKYNGRMPRQFTALRSLPGIGDYTAGALASIGFNQAQPALDGNARRVLQRLFHTRQERDVRKLAVRLISRSRPGDFNQALMDLGAEVCLPRKPKCGVCPCRRFCQARLLGTYSVQRVRSANKSAQVIWPLAIVLSRGRILLRHRNDIGLLAGMWEVPGGETFPGESVWQALRRHLGCVRGLGERVRPAGEVRHSITRYRIRAPVFVCAASDLRLRAASGWRWVSLAAPKRYPLSSLSMKAVKLGNLSQAENMRSSRAR